MALLERPATSRASTSHSRWVSPRWAPGQNSPALIRAADSATRPASVESMTTSPATTRCSWGTSSAPVDALEQEPGRARAQCLVQIVLVVVHGQQHHLGWAGTTWDRPAHVEPAVLPQPHVAQHDVRRLDADHRPGGVQLVALPTTATSAKCESIAVDPVHDHLVVVDENEAQGRPLHPHTVGGRPRRPVEAPERHPPDHPSG